MSLPCPSSERIALALDDECQDHELIAHLDECNACRRRLEDSRVPNPFRGALGAAAGFVELETEDSAPLVADFQVLREIRRGGQGVVYEAYDPLTSRRVALKTILPSAIGGESNLVRFEREISLIAGLDHPAIVRLYQSGRMEDGSLYFAMEYVAGQDLTAFVNEKGVAKSSVDVLERLELFIEICEAIGHAHSRGVVHRDLKPSNVRIDSEGHPHLLDFGLAKRVGVENSVEITGTIDFVGTVAWATPEQTPWSNHSVDLTTDVYALGHLLHWILTTEHPYKTHGTMLEVLRRISHATPKLPGSLLPCFPGHSDLDAIIARALEKDPGDRYSTVSELAEDCRCLMEGRPVSAQPSSSLRVLWKLVRKHKLWTALFVLAFIGLGLAALEARQEAKASARREALREQASLVPSRAPDRYRADEERAAWRILLSGAPYLDSVLPSLDAFPGRAARLDLMRSLYLDMPVTGTRRLSMAGFPVGIGDYEAAVLSNEAAGNDSIHLIQLPLLSIEKCRLNVSGASSFFFDQKRGWYLATEQGVLLCESLRDDAPPRSLRTGDDLWGVMNSEFWSQVDRPQLLPSSFLSYWNESGISDVWRGKGRLSALVHNQELIAIRVGALPPEIYLSDESGWHDLKSMLVFNEGQSMFDSWSGSCIDRWYGDRVPIVKGGLIDQLDGIEAFDDAWLPRIGKAHTGVRVGGSVGGGGDSGDSIEIGVFIGGPSRSIAVGRSPRKVGGEHELVFGHSNNVHRPLANPSGEYFLSHDVGGLLRCWDVHRILEGPLKKTLELKSPLSPLQIHAFAQSERFLVGAGRGLENNTGRVNVLPVHDNLTISHLTGHPRVAGAAFLPGSDHLLLLAPEHGELMLWDLDNGAEPEPLVRPVRREEDSHAAYSYLAANDSNGQVAVPTEDGTIHFLTFEPGELAPSEDKILEVPEGSLRLGRIPAVSWSPSGEWLAVGHYSGEITWVQNREVRLTHNHHLGPVRTVAASPDGKWVAFGSDDHTVSLWGWGDTRPNFTISGGHRNQVFAVAFDADSRRLATGDAKGLVQVWDVATWPDAEPLLLYRLDSKVEYLLALHFDTSSGSEKLYLGGSLEYGPMVWDPAQHDRYVAGNFEYWREELKDVALDRVLRELEDWSEKVLKR